MTLPGDNQGPGALLWNQSPVKRAAGAGLPSMPSWARHHWSQWILGFRACRQLSTVSGAEAHLHSRSQALREGAPGWKGLHTRMEGP